VKSFIASVTLAQLADVASMHARRRGRSSRDLHADAWRAEIRRILSHRDD
jgi:hypothetical protein